VIAKDTKEHANYRLANPKGTRRCGTCRYFEREEPQKCTKVLGTIAQNWLCDWYREKE
jgi:hypothetical protein